VVGILTLVKVAEEVLQGEKQLQNLSNNAKIYLFLMRDRICRKIHFMPLLYFIEYNAHTSIVGTMIFGKKKIIFIFQK